MGNSAFFRIFVVLLGAFSVKGAQIVRPYPKNMFPIVGSEVHTTCISAGKDGPQEIVKFQRRRVTGNWLDIAGIERFHQTIKKEGDKATLSLIIKNVTEEDGTWIYGCNVYSSGGALASSVGFSITVMKKEDLPIASVVPNNTVTYGDTVNLYCSLTHKNNEATVTISKAIFLKNGIPVMSTNDLKEPLIVANVTGKDGGKYACFLSVMFYKEHAYNITPTVTAYLHVRARFPIKESKVVAHAGDSISLNCSAEGYPLNITWTKNKPGSTAAIKADGRVTVKQQCLHCTSILVIQNLTLEDSGKYMCSALDFPGQHVFYVTLRRNLVSTATSPSLCLAAIFPTLLWIWGTV